MTELNSRHITRKGRGLGWRPSLSRHGRELFTASHTNLPPAVDLRNFCPSPYDQGSLGSCTGNALAFTLQFLRIKFNDPLKIRVPSRLMIYWLEREIEGTINSDSGAQGYDGITALTKTGTCFEDGPDGWPYDPLKFQEQPPTDCFVVAQTNRIIKSYEVTQDLYQMRSCLASGFPFIFGFTCYADLDSDKVEQTGVLPMPSLNEGPIGGHEVSAVGYNDATRQFLIRNSWGSDWGIGGYFWMPYEYLIRSDLASEFETVRSITIENASQ